MRMSLKNLENLSKKMTFVLPNIKQFDPFLDPNHLSLIKNYSIIFKYVEKIMELYVRAE